MAMDHDGYMPKEMVQRVLESAGSDLVLVGGQALAYWMEYYGIDLDEVRVNPVTRDVDFYTRNAANTAPVHRFASAIGGTAEILGRRSITALVGTAVADLQGRKVNVDVIHSVVGIKKEAVEQNAVEVTLGSGKIIRVMHPLDVLASRNVNLHKLVDKQNQEGAMQLQLAVLVVREYLRQQIDAILVSSELSAAERQREILNLISDVTDIAKKAAAKSNASRHGVHVADAIPADALPSGPFWDKQWQHLRATMSEGYGIRCEVAHSSRHGR